MMRWEQLFAALEAQFAALADDGEQAEFADRTRLAVGAVTMSERLAGSVDSVVRLRTSGPTITGVLRQVGPDWVLVDESAGRQALVRLAAVTGVEGLSSATGPALTAVALRLDLRWAVRGLARDRAPVSIVVQSAPADASMQVDTGMTGTVDRVGADFLELAAHAAWEPRRARSVRAVVLVPLGAVVAIRAAVLG
ncbi:hypothetical protein JL107_11100 [Nakamurella flavida]|uniref:Uncharacterized protein n=1 Tax=Nakamurella flavida TaxID=363630 RepID=A0A938YQA3_9ACTN|nr:hypothetical protein [Nakamurella flavida]MBM9476995.1 hypothetical protein [Nakamurella flavida]MDP9779940.1 hypothetical protein [Nakamurella flavida]